MRKRGLSFLRFKELIRNLEEPSHKEKPKPFSTSFSIRKFKKKKVEYKLLIFKKCRISKMNMEMAA